MVQGSVDQGNADEENILKDLPQLLKIYFATESLRHGCPDGAEERLSSRPRAEGSPDWSNNENHDNVPCIWRIGHLWFKSNRHQRSADEICPRWSNFLSNGPFCLLKILKKVNQNVDQSSCYPVLLQERFHWFQ